MIDTLCYIWSKLLTVSRDATCGVSSTCSCGVSSFCSCVVPTEEDVIKACAGFVKSFNILSVRALNSLKVSYYSGILAFLSAECIKFNMWKP